MVTFLKTGLLGLGMMVVLLIFLLCFVVGSVAGYLIGNRRGKIIVNLKAQEMDEMADRVAELEQYFHEVELALDELSTIIIGKRLNNG